MGACGARRRGGVGQPTGREGVAQLLGARGMASLFLRRAGCYWLGVTDGVWEFPVSLPRNAFNAREAARAGDIWRAFQDAATTGSIRAGWGPSRYREHKTSFLVYRMLVVHQGETRFADSLQARTWVSDFRRRTLSTRQIRICRGEAPLAAATQDWVHVDAETLKPKQASEEFAACYPVVDLEPSVHFPSFEAHPGAEEVFDFHMWQTWSDPLGHANHPAYVDWCDEATSRRMLGAGLDPVLLRPLAERVRFQRSVQPGEYVRIVTRRIGVIGAQAVVLQHQIETEQGAAAEATSIRSLAEQHPSRLIEAWD